MTRVRSVAGFVLAALLSLAATPATAQNKIPRTADGKPDLNGIWQAMNTANWDLQGHEARAGLEPNLWLALLERMGVQAENLGDSTGKVEHLTEI